MEHHNIQLLHSLKEERTILEDHIKQKASQCPLSILEAGCGNSWIIDLEGLEYILTGVDISETILEKRKNMQGDLREAILGDLRTVDLEANKFDVIYNSYVLEHIHGAEIVLDNFLRWLKPGGLLILKIPDRDSVFGFITRITPFFVHVLYKKYLRGERNAGKEGHGPFETCHDLIVSRKGIHDYCRKHGLIMKAEYGLNIYIKKHGIFSGPVNYLVKLMFFLSLGKLAGDHNTLTYIIEKP